MEMENQIRKLKKKKAAGEDEVKNAQLVKLHRRSKTNYQESYGKSGRGKASQKAGRGVIVLVYKKDNKDETTNYRGTTLLNTAYKINAMIIKERLIGDRKNKVLPDTSRVQEKP